MVLKEARKLDHRLCFLMFDFEVRAKRLISLARVVKILVFGEKPLRVGNSQRGLVSCGERQGTYSKNAAPWVDPDLMTVHNGS